MKLRMNEALTAVLCAAAWPVAVDAVSYGRRAALRSSASVDEASYPPKAPPYAWWNPVYGELAPTRVVDMCGGASGFTKWEEVSPDCARWTVTMLRCATVCNNAHHFAGFSKCMKDCGVKKVDCNWCALPDGAKPSIQNYCQENCKKWEKCGCATNTYETADEWAGCIATCAYDCKPSLEVEMDLGFPVDWRPRKCRLPFFSCGGAKMTKCTPIPYCNGPFDNNCVEKTCEPPVGQGIFPCWRDDMFCGGRGAYPNTTSDTNKYNMLDFCTKPKEEGHICNHWPLWKKSSGYPECQPELVCGEQTHKCGPPPPPPPPGPAPAPGPWGPGPHPAPAPAKPTEPPFPQWKQIQQRMRNLTQNFPAAAPSPAPA